MKNISKFTTFLIFFSLFLGVIYALPNFINVSNNNVSYSFLPGKKINLGLDLKGGSYLLLKADMDIVFEEKIQALKSDIRFALRKSKIGYKKLSEKNGIVSFQKRGNVSNNDVKSIIISLNKNLIIDINDNNFLISFSEINKQVITKATMAQAIEIVRRRIDETGTNEPSIQQQGADRIIVQLPGLEIQRLLSQ